MPESAEDYGATIARLAKAAMDEFAATQGVTPAAPTEEVSSRQQTSMPGIRTPDLPKGLSVPWQTLPETTPQQIPSVPHPSVQPWDNRDSQPLNLPSKHHIPQFLDDGSARSMQYLRDRYLSNSPDETTLSTDFDVAPRLPSQRLRSTPSSEYAPQRLPTSGKSISDEASGHVGTRRFDAWRVRSDFPILSEVVHGKPLVWLDNAATTQKPKVVMDRLHEYYLHENSNVHRAAHELARRATDAYESARLSVARFLNAPSADNVIFVRGTTEAINLVAQSWGRTFVKSGDSILISHLEHHANIVPWQLLTQEKNARLLVAPVDAQGQVNLGQMAAMWNPSIKLLAISHVSNALGTITPVEEIIALAHRHGVPVLLDAAQSVSHLPVDVQRLDCDFCVFSGHKIFGPTGIGVLYAKPQRLAHMPPWQGGGNMIQDVTFERTIFQPPPMKFEAGTGNIADAIGLGTALDYVSALGLAGISEYEHELLGYATEKLLRINGLRMIGTAPQKTSILSFIIEDCDPAQIGQELSREGIAVRVGHHCAQPILRRFGVEQTIRASLAMYNTMTEVDFLFDTLVSAIQHARRVPRTIR